MKKILFVATIIIIFIAVFFAKSFLISFFSPLVPKGGVRGGMEVEAAATKSGLVGYWTMDNNDRSRNLIYDKSGNGKHGTLIGTATSTGKIGQARSFNGSSEIINAGSNFNFSSSDQFTFSAWVYQISKGDDGYGGTILGKFAGTAGYLFYIYSTDGASPSSGLYWQDNQQGFTSNAIISLKQWHFVAFTRDATKEKMYVDGVNVAQKNNITLSGSASNFYIGTYISPMTQVFKGNIDDVRVYNRALSSQEVTNLYNATGIAHENSPTKASSTPSVSNQLVGYWTMDSGDRTGNKILDKSGFNNNGTLTGTATSTGRLKEARSFNGTTDWINVGDVLDMDTTNTITLSSWIKTGSIGRDEIIMAKWDADVGCLNNAMQSYLLGIIAAGQVEISINSTSNGADNTTNGVRAVNDNKWHHIVFTGADGVNGLNIYIDGVLDKTVTKSGTGILNSSTPLEIGSGIPNCAGRATYIFSGSLDDVRIYNYAFSSQEVANLYNAGKTTYANVATKTGLVGYWTMNNEDRSRNLIYDKSGFNNTGTLTGTTTSTGRIKEARTFNGAADHIDLFVNSTATTTLSPTSQVSVSAWIKLASTGSWSWIVSNASFINNVTGGYGLLRNSSGIYCFNVNIWSQQASTGVTAVVDGKWHHLAGTYDGVNMIAYFDGVPGAPVAYSSPITYYADEIFYIGGSTVGGFTYPWNGQIDDVRVYNRGLTAQEVSNLYNSAKTNFQ